MKKKSQYRQLIQLISTFTVIDWLIVVMYLITSTIIFISVFLANYYEIAHGNRVLVPIAPMMGTACYILVWKTVTESMEIRKKLITAVILLCAFSAILLMILRAL